MLEVWELGVASRSGRRVTNPPTHSNTNTPPPHCLLKSPTTRLRPWLRRRQEHGGDQAKPSGSPTPSHMSILPRPPKQDQDSGSGGSRDMERPRWHLGVRYPPYHLETLPNLSWDTRSPTATYTQPAALSYGSRAIRNATRGT